MSRWFRDKKRHLLKIYAILELGIGLLLDFSGGEESKQETTEELIGSTLQPKFARMILIGFALAYNNGGIAFTSKSEFRRALGNFNRAISLKPDYAEAYYNRALLYQSGSG